MIARRTASKSAALAALAIAAFGGVSAEASNFFARGTDDSGNPVVMIIVGGSVYRLPGVSWFLTLSGQCQTGGGG